MNDFENVGKRPKRPMESAELSNISVSVRHEHGMKKIPSLITNCRWPRDFIQIGTETTHRRKWRIRNASIARQQAIDRWIDHHLAGRKRDKTATKVLADIVAFLCVRFRQVKIKFIPSYSLLNQYRTELCSRRWEQVILWLFLRVFVRGCHCRFWWIIRSFCVQCIWELSSGWLDCHDLSKRLSRWNVFFFESWKYNLGVSFLLRCWTKSNRRQSKGSTARWSIWCRTIWPFPIAQCFTYHHSHEIGYYGWVGIGLILCFVVLYNKKRKTRSIFELIHFTIHTTRSKWITLTISLIQNSRF